MVSAVFDLLFFKYDCNYRINCTVYKARRNAFNYSNNQAYRNNEILVMYPVEEAKQNSRYCYHDDRCRQNNSSSGFMNNCSSNKCTHNWGQRVRSKHVAEVLFVELDIFELERQYRSNQGQQNDSANVSEYTQI